jgi:hypothetical protein
MITGDSMSNARGNTIPPYAAKFIAGFGSRATKALKAGSSAPINSQLAASGHQVFRIRLKESGVGEVVDVTPKL